MLVTTHWCPRSTSCCLAVVCGRSGQSLGARLGWGPAGCSHLGPVEVRGSRGLGQKGWSTGGSASVEPLPACSASRPGSVKRMRGCWPSLALEGQILRKPYPALGEGDRDQGAGSEDFLKREEAGSPARAVDQSRPRLLAQPSPQCKDRGRGMQLQVVRADR